MKIAFKKITAEKKNFALKLSEAEENFALEFCGAMYKKSNGLICINAHMSGEMSLCDDISGEDYIEKIERDIEVFASDGMWHRVQDSREYLDVVEFFEGYIDMDYIFRSEIESIKLEYHRQ